MYGVLAMTNGLGGRVIRAGGALALAVLAVASTVDIGMRMGLAPATPLAGEDMSPALALLGVLIKGASHVVG